VTEPDDLLSRVNDGLVAILKQSGTTMFATGFYLIVDVEHSQIRYASAGHPAPLLIGNTAAGVQPLNGKGSVGPAMGLFPAAKYRTVKRQIQEGDTVIMFTDGLFEVESDSGAIYTEQQLLDAVTRQASLPPQDMLDKVVSEVREFSHDKRFDDDVCVVGVQVLHTG
jgi:serine phosphatase RsbU (regulator of sigma subunit)